MTGQALTAEQFTQSVAENIAKQFDLKPSELLKNLIERLSSKLVDALIKKQTTTPIQQKPLATQALPTSDTKKSLLEAKEEPKPFLFAGFTEQGLKQVQDKLPEIIKKSFDKLIQIQPAKDKKEIGGLEGLLGAGLVKGALGVLSIIGGIFTLLYGLQTEGPFKGLAKLAGKGMLEIGKILTAPLKSFLENISDFLLKKPLEMISSFGKNIAQAFKTISKTILEKAVDVSKIILSPLTNLTKTIGDNLLAIPLRLFGSFKSAIGGIFEKIGETSIIKTGLGKITNFLPNLLKGLVPVLKKIPIIGTLISLSYAVSRFKSGDYVGGGIDILSGIAAIVPGIGTAMSIGLDALNAFLDMKSGGATEKQTGSKIDLLKGLGGWIGEKIIKLPLIGPLVKAVQHFASREWKKGLKQLAYAVPVIDAVAAFLGDEEVSDTAKAFAGTFKGINWSEIRSWLFQTFKNVPIIGPLMKAVESFVSRNYLEGIKQLAYINPIFEAIGGLLGDKSAGTISTAIGDWSVDLVTDLSKWITDSLKEIVNLDGIKEWSKKKLESVASSLNPLNWGKEETFKQPSTQIQTAGDAMIDSNGGLIVSSPKEGSLFQLSKNDGILAAPIKESSKELNQAPPISFTRAEKILEKIAENTGVTNLGMSNLINGFNNLAKSLEKAGINLNQGTLVNNIQGQQNIPKSTQIATAATSLIPSYRSFAETSRFVPV